MNLMFFGFGFESVILCDLYALCVDSVIVFNVKKPGALAGTPGFQDPEKAFLSPVSSDLCPPTEGRA